MIEGRPKRIFFIDHPEYIAKYSPIWKLKKLQNVLSDVNQLCGFPFDESWILDRIDHIQSKPNSVILQGEEQHTRRTIVKSRQVDEAGRTLKKRRKRIRSAESLAKSSASMSKSWATNQQNHFLGELRAQCTTYTPEWRAKRSAWWSSFFKSPAGVSAIAKKMQGLSKRTPAEKEHMLDKHIAGQRKEKAIAKRQAHYDKALASAESWADKLEWYVPGKPSLSIEFPKALHFFGLKPAEYDKRFKQWKPLKQREGPKSNQLNPEQSSRMEQQLYLRAIAKGYPTFSTKQMRGAASAIGVNFKKWKASYFGRVEKMRRFKAVLDRMEVKFDYLAHPHWAWLANGVTPMMVEDDEDIYGYTGNFEDMVGGGVSDEGSQEAESDPSIAGKDKEIRWGIQRKAMYFSVVGRPVEPKLAPKQQNDSGSNGGKRKELIQASASLDCRSKKLKASPDDVVDLT